MFTLNNFYKSKEWEALLEQLKLERVADAQNILAQEVAIKAYKEGKKFVIDNLHIDE